MSKESEERMANLLAQVEAAKSELADVSEQMHHEDLQIPLDPQSIEAIAWVKGKMSTVSLYVWQSIELDKLSGLPANADPAAVEMDLESGLERAYYYLRQESEEMLKDALFYDEDSARVCKIAYSAMKASLPVSGLSTQNTSIIARCFDTLMNASAK